MLAIGVPLAAGAYLWYRGPVIEVDQLLLAARAGDRPPRGINAKGHAAYAHRQSLGAITKHFRPGMQFWILVVLIRKASVVGMSLLFSNNKMFMLASVLLILFLGFGMQARF